MKGLDTPLALRSSAPSAPSALKLFPPKTHRSGERCHLGAAGNRYHGGVTELKTSPVRSGPSWASRFTAIAPLAALVLLVVGLSWYSPDFRKPENFVNILNQWSFVGIVALGMTYVIILGGIDLSVGSMVGLLAGLGMWFMRRASLPLTAETGGEAGWGWSAGAALALGLAIMLVGGPLLGTLNGLLVAVGRLPAFIATLGGLAIYRSVILAMAKGSEIPPSVEAFERIGSAKTGLTVPLIESSRGKPLVVTVSILAFLGCAVVAEIVLRRTVFGRRVMAVGDNAVAARYAGVSIGWTTTMVYMISGLMCGVAAVLNASRNNSVSSSQAGLMWELDAIAAVVIGGTAMRGGKGSVLGTVVGVLMLGVIDNMLVILDVNDHIHGLVKGVIIIGAVLMQRSRGTR